jgi:putative transposase
VLVNKKRVYQLMRENSLLVKPNQNLKAKRTANTCKPRPVRANEWWGIDMTKVMIDGFGWVCVVIVLDWYTKKIVGHYAGLQSKSEHWLHALDQAVNRQFPDGARNHGVHLMSDNGCQPTSIGFMKNCALLGVEQTFTSYNNPKGNADTERLMRTLKEELVWTNEWHSPFKFIQALGCWVNDYNNEYLHSALNYKTPTQFEQQTWGNSLLAAA